MLQGGQQFDFLEDPAEGPPPHAGTPADVLHGEEIAIVAFLDDAHLEEEMGKYRISWSQGCQRYIANAKW